MGASQLTLSCKVNPRSVIQDAEEMVSARNKILSRLLDFANNLTEEPVLA